MVRPGEAAARKFLALNSGNLAAYLEACVHCGQCATACHFYEVTGDPKYTPAYKLFPMARAHRKTKAPWRWFEGPIYRFINRQNEASMRAMSDWLSAHPEYRPELAG